MLNMVPSQYGIFGSHLVFCSTVYECFIAGFLLSQISKKIYAFKLIAGNRLRQFDFKNIKQVSILHHQIYFMSV